ncbi:MAG: methyltransferase [Candidatus Parvarchaeota archaeon]|jgi:tRNA (guanine37-N1)-methyltransferase|nr:methyltransferase [Candidatus Parvarchaeota archaeon]MCL5017875.1 methyltransferase [Candidatus Parvarchaeota archaeon]
MESPIDRGFDVIGSIAIIKKKPGEDQKKLRKLGEAIINQNKHISSVFNKVGGIEGEDRLMKLKWVAGDKKTLTLHKENGFSFYVDVKKVFFTPRMVSERLRVINQVKPNENVLDMFCGVGPFAIPIARRTSSVYALDINKNAIKLLEKNITLNKIKNMDFKCGDSRLLVKNLDKKFSRVIMNYPSNPLKFLKSALSAADEKCTLHYYKFINTHDTYAVKEEKNKIINTAGKNFRIMKIKTYKAGETAPFVTRMCFDITAKKVSNWSSKRPSPARYS